MDVSRECIGSFQSSAKIQGPQSTQPRLEVTRAEKRFFSSCTITFGPGFERITREIRSSVMFAEGILVSVSKAIFSQQPFLPGQKWEWLSSPFYQRREDSTEPKKPQRSFGREFSLNNTMSKKD